MSKGTLIKADIYSRPFAMDGKYTTGRFGLDNLEMIKDSDIFFLETMRMKADLADKYILEAMEKKGGDLSREELISVGEIVNSIGKPIHRSEAIGTAIVMSLTLIICYGIAVGIWGLVFRKSFLLFSFFGGGFGLLISIFSVAPVIAGQRTKERIKNITSGVHFIWSSLAIIMGVLGLVIIIIKLLFFT